VADTGPGIPAERVPRLFDPFFTTKETGMGMGLPISQTIVENHAGRIWADSAPGAGAVFYVRLPLAELPVVVEREAARAEAAAAKGDPRQAPVEVAEAAPPRRKAVGKR